MWWVNHSLSPSPLPVRRSLGENLVLRFGVPDTVPHTVYIPLYVKTVVYLLQLLRLSRKRHPVFTLNGKELFCSYLTPGLRKQKSSPIPTLNSLLCSTLQWERVVMVIIAAQVVKGFRWTKTRNALRMGEKRRNSYVPTENNFLPWRKLIFCTVACW